MSLRDLAKLLEAASEILPFQVVSGHFPFRSWARLSSCHTDSQTRWTFLTLLFPYLECLSPS